MPSDLEFGHRRVSIPSLAFGILFFKEDSEMPKLPKRSKWKANAIRAAVLIEIVIALAANLATVHQWIDDHVARHETVNPDRPA